MTGRSPLRFVYRFTFADGARRDFEVQLDADSLAFVGPAPEPAPEWTRLAHERCANCPLEEADHPRCPIAARVHPLVTFFSDRLSYERVDVVVETAGRSYAKKGSLQECLGSLFGIYMVASGCPVLNRLRPMVATHLPFMTSEESTYRTVSAFLLAQYFLAEQGGEGDFSLDHLAGFLAELRVTNGGFCRRLSSIGIRDASINALSTLNALGEITALEVETEDLRAWRARFLPHWS